VGATREPPVALRQRVREVGGYLTGATVRRAC
jgi:hypothetical protein